MDVKPTKLHQLHDAIMSIWTKIFVEYFQCLVECIPQIVVVYIPQVVETETETGSNEGLYFYVYFFNH